MQGRVQATSNSTAKPTAVGDGLHGDENIQICCHEYYNHRGIDRPDICLANNLTRNVWHYKWEGAGRQRLPNDYQK